MIRTRLTTAISIVVTFAVIFTAVLGLSLTTQAAEKKVKEKARITATTDAKNLAPLTDEESQAVALAAGRILLHVDEARQAIADQKKDDAVRNIDQGLKLVQIIENSEPKRKVTTEIQSGNISYHNEEEVAKRYVTIFDEQQVKDIVTPVVQAKKVSGGSVKPEKQIATDGGRNKESAKQIEPFEDFSMYRQTSMKLDMVLAKRLLEEAKKAMADGRNNEADDALQALQINGVNFSVISVELPLAEATDNLMLAKLQARDGMDVEAVATLKLASDDLKKYEALVGESRAKDVQKLYQDIDKLTKSLEGKNDLKNELEKVEKQISSWWNTAIKWFKK